MTMTIANLPGDLVNEILSRVPLKYMRAVRLTCKRWNDISKTLSFTKLHIGNALVAAKEGESQMIVLMGNNLYLKSIVLNGDPSIKHKAKLTCLDLQVKISEIFQYEGLLLCILKDDSRLVVWNPYLGQPRWIEPRYSHLPYGRFSYALGYVNKGSCRSYKLLRFIDYYYNAPENQFSWYEIYDFESDLWTTLDVTPNWRIQFPDRGVSLKGNTYFCASKGILEEAGYFGYNDHIIRFDFTSERFGPLLPLPFNAGYDDYVTLSCVKEDKLAVLLQQNEVNPYEFDLWITTKIETERLLWSKFLRIETPLNINVPFINGNFFIDEEKKLAIGFDENCHKVNIIGDAGYFRALDLVREPEDRYSESNLVREIGDGDYMWSYVPSLVQTKQPAGGERKQDSDLEKRRYDESISRSLLSLEKRMNEQYPGGRGRLNVEEGLYLDLSTRYLNIT